MRKYNIFVYQAKNYITMFTIIKHHRLLLLFVLILNAHIIKAGAFDSYHNKYISYYLKGDFKSALTFFKKSEKKVVSGYEKAILYYEWAFASRSVGYYKQATEYFQKAEAIRTSFPVSSNENVSCLLESAQYHRVFENYNALQGILDNLSQTGISSEELRLEILGLRVEIATGRREFSKALELYSEYNSKLGERKPETLYKERTLSPVLTSFYYCESARLYSVLARTLVERGDYTNAEKILENTKNLVTKRSLSKMIGEWNYHLAKGDVALAQQNFEDAETAYKKCTDILPLHKSHYSYEGTVRYTDVLSRRGKTSFANKIYMSFLEEFQKFPGEKSSNLLYRYKIESDIAKANNEWYKAKERLNYLVQDTFVIPSLHPQRLIMLSGIYKIDIYTGYRDINSGVNSAEDRLTSMSSIVSQLYGKQCPYLSFINVQKACYLVDYTARYQEAKKIFATDFEANLLTNYNPQQVDFFIFYQKYSKLEKILENYSHALELLDKADKILQANKLSDEKSNLKYAINKGMIYFDKEEPGEAQKFFQPAFGKLMDYNSRNADPEIAMMLKQKANWELSNDLFREAKKTIKKEEEISTVLRTEQKADIPDNSTFWFDYNVKLTRITSAGEHLLPNKVFVKFDNKLIQTQYDLLIRFAEYYLLSSDYISCERFINKALEIADQNFGKNTRKYNNVLTIKYKLMLAMGDYSKAQELCNQVIAFRLKSSSTFSVQLACAYADQAEIRQLNGAPEEEVEALYFKALDIFKIQIGEQRIHYGNTCIKIANLYISSGRFDDAKKLLLKADDLIAEVLDKKNTIKADIKVKLGDIAIAQGELNHAEKNYKGALKIYQLELDNTHPSVFHTESRLARYYFLNNESKKCNEIIQRSQEKYRTYIQHYFPYLSENERLKFWNSIKGEFNFYNVFFLNNLKEHPEMAGEIYNNTLLTKAILLNASLKTREQILNSNDTRLKSTFIKYTLKKELLLAASNMTPKEMEEEGINQEQLEKDIVDLEKELSLYSDIWENINETRFYKWEHIKDRLADGEAAVEIIRLNHVSILPDDSVMYAAIIITNKSEFPQTVIFPLGTKLETKMIKYYRNSMKAGMTDDFSYKSFLEPIVPYILNRSKVFISVDGVYNQLNLETLVDNDGNYVIDKYNIVLLSNTKEIARNKKVRKGQKIVYLFGNPKFYANENTGRGNVEQLPGTDKEIKAISKIMSNNDWNVNTYLDTLASEKNLKSVKNPGIIHIATHGFFKELSPAEKKALENSPAYNNPLLRSGLLLYNAGEIISQNNLNYNSKEGILTAYEAMNLNLNNTNLIVLSACETGLGEIQAGEGVFGLQRTFFVAGAETLVMSLFKVSDEVTQKLMIKFYSNMNAGMTMRNSFLEAKREIKKEYPEPRYWGSFVMIGVQTNE